LLFLKTFTKLSQKNLTQLKDPVILKYIFESVAITN
jgi:hypothetical protein